MFTINELKLCWVLEAGDVQWTSSPTQNFRPVKIKLIAELINGYENQPTNISAEITFWIKSLKIHQTN